MPALVTKVKKIKQICGSEMEGQIQSDDEQKSDKTKTKLYRRRCFFLLIISTMGTIGGFNSVAFGQVSNIFAELFRVSYAQVDWLTLGEIVGSVVVTAPLSWMMASKLLRLRMLLVGACFITTVAYSCLAISAVSRSLFPLMVSAQLLSSIASAGMSATPIIFAALWFPENQVGTAIGVIVMSAHLGSILGLTIPTNVLAQPTRQENKTFANETNHSWVAEDQVKFGAIFATMVLILLIYDILLFIFCTDRPPTPPTKAQELKLESDQFSGFLSLKAYIDLLKALFKNKNYILSSVAFGILNQANMVEITMLSQILRHDFEANVNIRQHADVLGGYIMTVLSASSLIGSAVGAKIVDRYKRYNVITILSVLFTFVSSVGLLFAFFFKSLPLWFVFSALYGFLRQPGVIAIFDLVAQETYPMDEMFVTIWLNLFVTLMSIFFGEMGRVIFNAVGSFPVLSFQSSCLLVGALLSCFMKLQNKRLNAETSSALSQTQVDERTALMTDE